MVILHGYAAKRSEAQAETDEFFRRHESDLVGMGFTVLHVPLAGNTGRVSAYEQTVRLLWGRDAIIFVEHDIVPTVEMLIDLATCPAPICTQFHRLHLPANFVEDAEWIEARIPAMDERCRDLLIEHSRFPLDLALAKATRPHAVLRNGVRCFEPPAHRQVVLWPLTTWGDAEDRWADMFALGLTKISLQAQRDVTDFGPGEWHNLDSRIAGALWHAGYHAHMHHPEVRHNHRHGTSSLIIEMQLS